MTPDDLLYTKQHEWIRVEGQTATEGITDFAQAALGDITFVELPALNKKLKQGDEAAQIESCKAAASVYAAVSGTVVAVNSALEEDPAAVNSDPYGEGWLFKIEADTPEETGSLLNAEQYNKHTEEA